MYPTKQASDKVVESRKAGGLRPSKKKAARRDFEMSPFGTGESEIGFGDGIGADSVGASAVCPHCLEGLDSAPAQRGAGLFLTRPD